MKSRICDRRDSPKNGKIGRTGNGREGNTMVSVIVAFMMLLSGMAMVYTAVITSVNLTNRAEETRKTVESEMVDYYSDERVEDNATQISVTASDPNNGDNWTLGESDTAGNLYCLTHEKTGIIYYQYQ